MYWPIQLLFWLLVFCVFASAVYHGICIYSAQRFFFAQAPHPNNNFTPPVSILKPVRGVDDRAYDCWVSFCKQQYPDYEIIFGVRDTDDPAIELIKKLQQEFAHRTIKLVINSTMIGVSAKVSNLHNMFPEAIHEIVIVSDSDILVGPDYLSTVVAPLVDEQVGAVTCLYRAIGSTNFSALLEAVGITGEFFLGVLTARQLEGVKFAFGSTIVTRKRVMAKYGGFAAIADYLADDFLMGNLAVQAGYKVCISNYIVETILPDYQFTSFIQHQLRWARGTKHSRPSGYLGMLFTFSTALALLLLICFPFSLIAWSVAGLALGVRFLAAWLIGGVWMQDRRLQRYFYLLPLRDLISFFIWLLSFVGRTVHWRGDLYYLSEGGRLVRAK